MRNQSARLNLSQLLNINKSALETEVVPVDCISPLICESAHPAMWHRCNINYHKTTGHVQGLQSVQTSV